MKEGLVQRVSGCRRLMAAPSLVCRDRARRPRIPVRHRVPVRQLRPGRQDPRVRQPPASQRPQFRLALPGAGSRWCRARGGCSPSTSSKPSSPAPVWCCVVACDEDNCHHLEGSRRCARRVDYLRGILDEVGLGRRASAALPSPRHGRRRHGARARAGRARSTTAETAAGRRWPPSATRCCGPWTP